MDTVIPSSHQSWADASAASSERASQHRQSDLGSDPVSECTHNGNSLVPSGGNAQELEARVRELERVNGDLQRQKEDLERRIEEDSTKFLDSLEAEQVRYLWSLEMEVEQVRKQNAKLMEERTAQQLGRGEDVGRFSSSDEELRSRCERQERDHQDVLQQMDEFEREKEEELRVLHEELESVRRQVAEAHQELQSQRQEFAKEKQDLIVALDEETQALQTRIDKLSRDKDSLSYDLAANADRNLMEANRQLADARAECDQLKDQNTRMGGELSLLRSQVDMVQNQLRLSDMENAMLTQKNADLANEVDTLRAFRGSLSVQPLGQERFLAEDSKRWSAPSPPVFPPSSH